MTTIHTVIIGAGQAGLAISRCLAERGVEHVTLERSRVAERWRSERWDSLRLLTPNWMSRLPGYSYQGPDPDGYMTMPEVVDYLEDYAESSRVPLETQTDVRRVSATVDGYFVETSRGNWRARNVVIATGYCDRPAVPPMAHQLPRHIHQLSPTAYRSPDLLAHGGVLIVGAAASGIQLADEIADSGRRVVLSVGRHTRMPRRYRGRDILWWLDRMGVLDETTGDVFDLEASRGQPALQLVGRPDFATIDLGRLAAKGVRMTGRALGAEGGRVHFDQDLIATTTAADVKLVGLESRIDAFIDELGLSHDEAPPEDFAPLWPRFFDASAPICLDLESEDIRTVIWATGFRRAYPWLAVPVLDRYGEIRHDRGITPAPGLYVLGMQFQHRRKSAFIDGVGDDAAFLARHIAGKQTARRISVA